MLNYLLYFWLHPPSGIIQFIVYLWLQVTFHQLMVNFYEIITETVLFIHSSLKQIKNKLKTN